MGPWRPAKDRSRDVLAFCVQFHQNRPNINEMAAFQSLAIHLLINDGNGLDTKGSVTETLCHSTTNTKYVHTHTKTHTNTIPHALTHSLTHSPTHPPTHSLTNFNASSVNEAGRFWAHGSLKKTDLETYLHFASSFIKIGQILTKWQRFKVWPLNY